MPDHASQLIIHRRQERPQFYEEGLAEGVLPLRMMLIPAGTFLMGSPDEELERLDREGPQHEVTLSRFFLAKYPVTQAQWRVVAGMPQVNRELAVDPSHFKGAMHPVEQVSWAAAGGFCARLTSHPNRRYRLPTEAEWEYACRAGTTTPFHFGETISTDYANYRGTDNEEYDWSGSYGDGPKGDYREETTPVDHFEGANVYGLCDMHGNVWEWCQDHWHSNYEGAPNDGSAWLSSDESEYRILRGGSWVDLPGLCRSAYRDFNRPGIRNSFIGFRVCCSAPRALP
ncbi:MAG: formylglycine-generating enzyme family protein [Cyanobacteria bacterium P01_F01_bin.42]